MLHVINHDTLHLLNVSTHANLHETNLPIYIFIIAIIITYNFDCYAKEELFPLMIYI